MTPRPPDKPRFLSVHAAATILGVSPMTLYRLIANNEFPAIRLRSRLVIPAHYIDDMTTTAITQRRAVDTAEWRPPSPTG